ncbi:hypothetical protein [Sphingomonas endophytica]|uniref:Uncharacterized protein n=1 Tax=Sphingomonas endophytica TaxID=869719 RepID=A0A147I1K4_9SPHN|nr:hypothetical protein [Sphingomonas endophytica]KTT71474.1 hypothetical protein NS334_10335 [Sphingomonas endophytica]
MSTYTVPTGVADVPLKPIEGAMPMHWHEGQVEHEGFNNSALRQASQALGFLHTTYNADNEFRGNQDPEDRAAKHDRLVRERVEASERAAEQRLGSAMQSVRGELQHVERNLEEAAGLKANPAHFNAITSAFFMMKPGQRAETLAGLIQQGENAALATLIEAPLFLTGLVAEQRDNIRNRVMEKADPAAFRLRNALLLAMTKIDAAGDAMAPTFAKLRAGTEPGAAKTRAELAAARNIAAHNGR